MTKFAKTILVVSLLTGSCASWAQDLRYSWFEISYTQQDIDRAGSLTDAVIAQTVDISARDGSGVKFRGSLGTWHNVFAFIDYSSTGIDVGAVVSNSQGQFPVSDEYDFTAIRGGVGAKWSLTGKTDIYGAVSYDSTDHDFGSFAGENFDSGDKDLGVSVGVRSMLGDKVELRGQVRYSAVGDVDLTTGILDADTLFSVGFGYELIRGLSVTGDYESGQFSSWNIGFRLDLDEN